MVYLSYVYTNASTSHSHGYLLVQAVDTEAGGEAGFEPLVEQTHGLVRHHVQPLVCVHVHDSEPEALVHV